MKIKEVSKDERRSVYSFDKTPDFWKKSRIFLKKAKVYEFFADTFGNKLDAQDRIIGERDISKIKDERNSFECDDKSDIDFIFGDKKVFLIISYKKDLQNKFSKLVYGVF